MTESQSTGAVSRAPMRGVFSRETTVTLGQGAQARPVSQEAHFYVEECEDGRVAVTRLNEHFVPSGEADIITRNDLLENYTPNPEVYYLKVRPAMESLETSIATAERHRVQNRTYSAEYEYKNALRVDEENIRATFGLGLTYLERHDKDKAEVVFRRLVRLKEAFEPRHKHLFNEFGIRLRKNGMHVPALKYYSRAYHLCRTDEHLVYNIARVYHERGMTAKASLYLRKALAINPDFKDGQEFLAYLSQQEDQDALIELRAYDGKAKKKRKRFKISREFRIKLGAGAAQPRPGDDDCEVPELDGPAMEVSVGDVQTPKAGPAATMVGSTSAGEFSFRFVKPTQGKEMAHKIKAGRKPKT
ncbi:MAG: tetratricopeptide repeat protein [Desulfovibrionaceae bacterium]